MPDPTPDEEPLLGGRYRIVRQLGEGGMGTVHEAIQEGLGRRVAVKLLHPGRVTSDRQRARFRREAETIARLLHPNLVQVTDFGIDGARPFMVMEYLEGESLRGYLHRMGRLPAERAVTIVAAVLAALRVVHAAGVVHRDIKPGNIFLVWDDDGRPIPKLLDFGIASGRYQADSEPESEDGEEPVERPSLETERLTRTDSIFGTVAYMAPEQVRSAKLAGPAADQYAVGVVLYECLSGRLPHEGDSAAMLSVSKLRHAPSDIRELCPDLPDALAEVVMRTLSFEPGARYEDVSALRSALVGGPNHLDSPRNTLDSTVDTLLPPTTAPSSRTRSVPTKQDTMERSHAPAAATDATVTTAELGGMEPPKEPERVTALDSATTPVDAPPPARRGWVAGLAAVFIAALIGVPLLLDRGAEREGTSTPAAVDREPRKGREVAPLKAGPEAATPTRASVPNDAAAEVASPTAETLVGRGPRRGRRRPTRPTAAPPSNPATTAARRGLTVTGYDEWTAAVHLDSANGAINRCVESSAPAAGASAAAHLSIDDDGAASGCRVGGVEASLATCLCSALRALNWSPPPGGRAQLTVRYALQ